MIFDKRNQKTIRGIKWTIIHMKDEDGSYFEAYAMTSDGSTYIEASTYDELLKDINAEIDLMIAVRRKNRRCKL